MNVPMSKNEMKHRIEVIFQIADNMINRIAYACFQAISVTCIYLHIVNVILQKRKMNSNSKINNASYE